MKRNFGSVMASVFLVFGVMGIGGTTSVWAETRTLTITILPSGSGKVTSSPAGIDCPTVCTKNYTAATTVTLTATPASGFIFSHWSGEHRVDVDCEDGIVTVHGVHNRTGSRMCYADFTKEALPPPQQPASGVQAMDDFSFLPPFLGVDVKPNILFILDTSGSMNAPAYSGYSDYTYTKTYFGYFESTRCYVYQQRRFTPDKTANPPEGLKEKKKADGTFLPCKGSSTWDGNFLNWVAMRRIDIAKQALTGGLCASVRSSVNACTRVKGQQKMPGFGQWNYGKLGNFSKIKDPSGAVVRVSPYTDVRCIVADEGSFFVYPGEIKIEGGVQVCHNLTSTKDSFLIEVDAGVKQTGVIQEIGDRARFGLMIFDTQTPYHNGGEVVSDVGSSLVDMVQKIEGAEAKSWTPLAETLYQASLYFAQKHHSGFTYTKTFTVSVGNDPYCVRDLDPKAGDGCFNNSQGQWVPCCRSFVLLFTDGESTQDTNIPTNVQDIGHIPGDHAASIPTHHIARPSDNATHYLDDVAYWAHTTDLRPTGTSTIATIGEPKNKNDLPGMQNITFYPFFAFGRGSKLLVDAAKLGGFEDSNDNKKPDLVSEWDRINNITRALVPDGLPDNYFEAENADVMRTNLLVALNDILQKSASGTAVSFLGSSSSGEGAIYQSYFFPSSNEPSGAVAWVGYLHGLFLDSTGQLREDTNQDGRFILSDDKIVETYFDTDAKAAKVRRCTIDDTTKKKVCKEAGGLDKLNPLWEAGKLLAQREADTRNIITWVDGNNNGAVNTSEVMQFKKENAGTLMPYLRAISSPESENIIEFIRGKAVPTFRNRERTIDINGIPTPKTWKLGDIFASDPISVGAPVEAFDKKFGDSTYTSFALKYQKRRHVVYVGANDGMLHAFNAGFFHSGDDLGTTPVEHGYFTTTPNGSGGTPLGKELWGFIPQDLLPHLRWLKQDNYTAQKHVSYVDGSPRIVDARIFSDDSDHPNGWGTILIGSMRMGGGFIQSEDLNRDGDKTDPGEGEFYSAYFALDITNPEKDPTLLWVFKEADLGFTTSFPAIMRMNTAGGLATDAGTWYAVFGSGPTTYKGERISDVRNKPFSTTVSIYGKIYVVNLKPSGGAVTHTKIAVDPEGSSEKYAFMGDPTAVNIEKDYQNPSTKTGKDYIFDAIYIGKTFGSTPTTTTGGWKGKMHRLLTYKKSDPAFWTLSTLFDPGKPVLIQPTIALTRDLKGSPWIFFGTGRFFSSGTGDQTDTTAQGLYGIKEGGTNGCWDPAAFAWRPGCINKIPLGTNLFNSGLATIGRGGKCLTGCEGKATLSELVKHINNTKDGWFLNLGAGERILRKSTLLAGVLAVPSYTPVEAKVCETKGDAVLYALEYESGTAYATANQPDGPIGMAGDVVRRDTKGLVAGGGGLGVGIASRVALIANKENVTGYIQTSTGDIVQIIVKIDNSVPKQGVKIFHEETD